MAYVRKRGNQLSIVQGERDPESGNVCQRILFTLYSKKEAFAALDDGQSGLLQGLLECEYPEIRFPWKRIWWSVARNMDVLPEEYEYRETEMVKRFRSDLCAFTRQLVLNDPQWLFPSAELLQQHRFELEYLIELIGWRLKLCDAKPDEFNRDNEFYWRFRLRGREVPTDTEEGISALYDRGDLDRTEAVVRLMVDTFEDDAESHNYLGMIALKRGNLDEAARRFTMMMELSRKRLPRRLTPRVFGHNHHGKPYRRGLSNLVLTLNRMGQYDKALAHADKLERVCGDDAGAAYYQALIHLNRGAWEDAANAARHVRNLWQETSLVAALAYFEMGRSEESVADFLHGACNHPLAALLIAGRRPKKPTTRDEDRDWDVGTALLENAGAYLSQRGSRVRRFFGSLITNPGIAKLLSDIEETRRQRDQERQGSTRVAWDVLRRMESVNFAQERAGEICRQFHSAGRFRQREGRASKLNRAPERG
jgi:tetratricopeptide (TPR) repeat protein